MFSSGPPTGKDSPNENLFQPSFPEDARWNAERQAVEFGVGIGEYQGVVRFPRRGFQRLLPDRPPPRGVRWSWYLPANRVREHRRTEAAPTAR
jgi:hypothetical protein